ncbi:anthranilate phosphoribosyltransferase [Marinilabilia salmonicolor]|jgi:anthranilate phosphoribosyltransferase|uniref:Anthranilate phosphoribosyltransferase n=1 Tax=Marinilabilia salmonicolor TaxID=989 RepID=A0A2T0XT88_9BACT|nr:anthranilate phosphoribosyltransferase [Marinilabilia salmonicolor]PRZ02151.1 anthranilate phosphoribosyltransferase [Marinilabilia salmonicolor]RCW36106.1 anthranilate phosphoribosyltransferase [Marinilabilia salmonicolor]
MLQPTLKRLFEYNTLSKAEAKEVLVNITRENYSKSEVVAFLSVFMMRPVTVEELSGFRDGLLEQCKHVDLSDFQTIDMCGTGGDGKNTFNISTLASLVVAGAGYKVAKHGNTGVSSACGSSNVMEYLGYKFTNDNELLKRQIDQSGICFLHAPLFHPAMKAVGPIRRELGIKTFFNMLGPMVNPAHPQFQLVGVFSLELARIYQYIYQQSTTKFSIVHSIDGYDEVSLTDAFKVISHKGEKLLKSEDINLPPNRPEDIFGGNTVEESASIFKKVMAGEGTPAQKNAVLANAALAINTMDEQLTFEQCLQKATDSLEGGKAAATFKKLLEII